MLNKRIVQTLWRLSGKIHVEQRANLVSVHVAPCVTLDASHITHFNAKWLILNHIITLQIPACMTEMNVFNRKIKKIELKLRLNSGFT